MSVFAEWFLSHRTCVAVALNAEHHMAARARRFLYLFGTIVTADVVVVVPWVLLFLVWLE